MKGVLVVLASVLLVTSISSAGPPTKLGQLKKQNRVLKAQRDNLLEERDAQDVVIEDLNTENAKLKDRLANQPDPLTVITSRDADGLWDAMIAIWRVFPTQPPGLICGYDRGNVLGDGVGLTTTIYSFYRWTGC